MSGTALYRALRSANADDELATQAAKEVDDMRSILVELRTTNRILIVLVLAILAQVLLLSFRF